MEEYSEYLFASLPLIISHIALPPISLFSGNESLVGIYSILEPIYSLIPTKFLNPEYIFSLAFDVRSFSISNPPWTLLSHIFVHGSYDHMLNNLTAAIQFGLVIYREYGAYGMYILFISGGVFSAIPSALYNFQQQRLTKDIHSVFSTDLKFIPKFISKPWNSSMFYLAKHLTKNLSPKKYIGSSGAVCAFIGADTILVAKQCFLSIYNEYKYISNLNRNNHSYYYSNISIIHNTYSVLRRVIFGKNPSGTILNILHIIRSIIYFTTEINNAYTPVSSSSNGRWDTIVKSVEKLTVRNFFMSIFIPLIHYMYN